MAQVAVCSQINTKHINTVWAERTAVNVKLVVHHVISRVYKVKFKRGVQNNKKNNKAIHSIRLVTNSSPVTTGWLKKEGNTFTCL